MNKSIHNLVIVYIFFITGCGIDLSGALPFDDLNTSPDFKHISVPDGHTWDVTFEYPTNSTFTGIVRHIGRWHDSSVPFMSHDILVTTGDFASQEFVDVSVIAHKFFYHWDDTPPNGSINLLHIFPASEEVFEQLKRIKNWNSVSISGREILKIDLYDPNGRNLGFITDMGCNTILVMSVNIHAEGTPIPEINPRFDGYKNQTGER